jgi:HlyD family secretion protein
MNRRRTEPCRGLIAGRIPIAIRVAGSILALVALAFAVLALTNRAGSAARRSAEEVLTVNGVKADEPIFAVVQPRPGGVARFTLQPGSVEAFEAVDLYAMVSGYLEIQTVDIGSHVKKGELLAKIGVPREESVAAESAALVEQAKAEVVLAETRLKSCSARKSTAETEVIQAKADVVRATAKHKLADSQLNRVKNLRERQVVDERLLEEQTNDAAANAALEQVSIIAVKTAEAKLNEAIIAIEQARAEVDQYRTAERVAEAKLAKAKVDLAYSKIVAPFDGVVTRRTFHPGAFIRAAGDGGAKPMLTVERTDLMRVVIRVPDRDVVLADAGDPAEVAIDALGGELFQGVIARIAESEDSASRTMRVEIDVPNPKRSLRSGMYGRAKIRLEQRNDRSTIPLACVFDRATDGRASVKIVRDGRVRTAKITIAGDDGVNVEVVSGLRPSDRVVVSPDTTLDDGANVLTTNYEK